MNKKIISQAINLYKHGYKIIPLRGKKPTIPGWQNYHNVVRTENELQDAFSNADNIGMLTGKKSNVTVVDIDYKNKDGSAKFKTTLEDFLKLYPTDVVVETGSGNHHLYYTYNPSLKTGADIDELFGADVRNDGGQVVIPPSTNPDGKPYKFVARGNLGKIELETPIVIDTKTTEKTWISDLLMGVAHGSRDNACTKLAGYYHSKGIPTDILRNMLLLWNEKNTPPLSTNHIEKIIASVTKYKSPEGDKTSKLSLVPFDQYMLQYSNYSVEWMVDGWLPTETILFMVAPPQSYKTWMLMDLAVSVAGGYKFLNQYQVNKTGPVLIFQQEDHHGQTVARIATVLQAKCELKEHEVFMPELPIYVQTSRDLSFSNKDKVKELEDLIEKYMPALVIIDPLYSAIPIDDYMAKGAEYMFPLKTFRDKYKCSFAIAHHSKKSSDSSSIDRSDLWGSQFLNAFLESGWQIRKSGESSVKVKRHFKVAGPQRDLALDFDIYTEYPSKYVVNIAELQEEVNDKGFTKDSVLQYIRKLKVITPEKIEKKFSIHPEEVEKMLSMFIIEGILAYSTDGYILL